jgi:hypothetical protein
MDQMIKLLLVKIQCLIMSKPNIIIKQRKTVFY